jgi:uncharacterized YigZ family protein
MLFEDTYKTIAEPADGIYRDKGSKFIAYAYPITQEEQVKPLLASLRAEHSKARHFCWAFRLTADRSIFRLNDDGEPSGTAGRPILNSLLSAELTNLVVVVVRYFGGTLLGVPGLINAYKSATQEALAKVLEKTVNDLYLITFDYLGMNEVMKVLKEEHIAVESPIYDSRCSINIEIRKARLNAVLSRLEHIETLTATYIGTV